MKTRAYFIGLILFVCLISLASAYTIVGNSVIEEDAASKLEVYPHTIYSPIASNLEQTFKLTNKTASTQNVYIAYKFDKPVQAGKVFTITPAVYEWVENQSFTCNGNLKYTYELNKYPANPGGNVNFLHCYQTLDNNTPANTNDDFNRTIKDINFSRGDLPAKTIYWKTWTQTAATSETDHSNLFSNATYLNDTYYYLANPITFNAGETKTWNLRYTPNKLDTSKKWELAFYTGANANCIINNSCNYVQWLDPWWDNNWTAKQKITLKTSSMSLSADVTQDHAILIDINSTNINFWNKVRTNCYDVRFLNADENVKLTYDRLRCDSNRFIARLKITETFSKTSDLNVFIYYGNNFASDDSNTSGTYPTTYKSYLDMNSTTNKINTSYNISATGSPTLTLTNCKVGYCYQFNGSNYFTSAPVVKDFSSVDFSVIYWAKLDTALIRTPFVAQDIYSEMSTSDYILRSSYYQDTLANGYGSWSATYDDPGAGGNSSTLIYFPTGTDYNVKPAMHFSTAKVGGNNIDYLNLNTATSTPTTPVGVNKNLMTETGIGARGVSHVDYFTGTIDEIRVLNYQITSDERRVLYLTEADNNYTLFGAELTPASIDINFVVQDQFDNLNLVNSMDCNSGTITYTNQTSPYLKTITDLNKTYSCTFTSIGYDSNTILIYTDVNKTYTIKLTDSTPPIVSNLTIHDFNTYNSDRNYIKGTGYFTADFNHPGHPVNTCSYTLNNGNSFLPGSVTDNNKCTSPSFTITDDTNYNVWIRVTDESLNYADSNHQNYFGDLNAPTTSTTATQFIGQTKSNIQITCNDFNKSGCNTIKYILDGNTAQTYTTDFNVTGTGSHTIQAWATDNLDNNSYPGITTSFTTYGNITINVYDDNSILGTIATASSGQKTFNQTLDSTTDYVWSYAQTFSLPAATTNFPSRIKIYGNMGVNGFGFAGRFRFYDSNSQLVSTEVVGAYCDLGVNCEVDSNINIPYDIKSFTIDIGCSSGASFPTSPGYCAAIGQSVFNWGEVEYDIDSNLTDPINNATIRFNGINTSNLGSNSFYFNLNGITPGNYVFDINAPGYSTCTQSYLTNLTQFSDLNINFGLIKDEDCAIIPLKVYQTDATTIFNNTSITIINTNNNLIVGRAITDSIGRASFGLNSTEQPYQYLIQDGNFTYTPVSLTILYPRDEETFATISGTWGISITNNFSATYTGLNSDQTILLLPDTETAYNIRIEDTNGNYFARNYQLTFPGNPQTYILQPYLVSVLNGLLTTIRSVSGFNNQPIANVNIKIYKDINGSQVLVEDVITDDKGEAIVLMVTGDAYYFHIYYNGLLVRIDNITATSSTIYIRLDDLIYTNPVYENISALVNFAPAYGTLSLQDKKLIQVIKINDSNSGEDISRIWINVINTNANGIDGNNSTIYSLIIPYTDQNTITNTIDINALTHLLNGVSYDTEGRLLVQVIIETSDANYTSRFEYQPYRGTNPIYSLGFGSRSFFGCESYYDQYGNPNPLIPCPNQLLIALFISFICVASLSFTLSFTNPAGLGAIFLLIMGIFTYLTFVPIVLYGIMVAAFFVVVLIAKGRFN